MDKTHVQLVWFKRDLRVVDHAPLSQAAQRGPVLPLYVAETGLWEQPDTAARHWAFIAESLLELRQVLAATGFPFVDACMRALEASGWINFRMREMLMSFASYHLWLHWRQPALFLARRFTDYEPGIHYAQSQMQAGTTGINTFRIYNPVKQSQDQDPAGRFIRQWLPQLARVPDRWIHTPWEMDGPTQRKNSCVIGDDYPPPVVDHVAAAKAARQRMGALRRGAARAEGQKILQRHGSRKGGLRVRP